MSVKILGVKVHWTFTRNGTGSSIILIELFKCHISIYFFFNVTVFFFLISINGLYFETTIGMFMFDVVIISYICHDDYVLFTI